MTLFMSKQVILPKYSLMLQKKSTLNTTYVFFAHKPSIIVSNTPYHSKKYILICKRVNKKWRRKGDS